MINQGKLAIWRLLQEGHLADESMSRYEQNGSNNKSCWNEHIGRLEQNGHSKKNGCKR